jgi:hypothetical protein
MREEELNNIDDIMEDMIEVGDEEEVDEIDNERPVVFDEARSDIESSLSEHSVEDHKTNK